jgi:hypothetical protein
VLGIEPMKALLLLLLALPVNAAPLECDLLGVSAPNCYAELRTGPAPVLIVLPLLSDGFE